MTARTASGLPLTPGVNVDRIDIAAGLRSLEQCGWSPTEDPRTFILIEFCLMRWQRGEEAQAQAQAIGQHEPDAELRAATIDLTSWLRVISAAQAHAHQPKHLARRETKGWIA